MAKDLKYFTNSRGWNYFPDYPERFPGGSRVLSGERPYTSTNNAVAFWRYYDEQTIEETIQKMRQVGVNNIRVWFHYYTYEFYKNLDDDENPYVQRIKHLVRTLEDNCMYCCWVFFDGLIGTQFQPTPGEEHLQIDVWQYFPATTLATNSNFMENSGIPYIEKMCSLTSGSQASLIYEFGNELKIQQFTSANIVKGLSAICKFTSGNPNIKRALGVVLQSPWHDIPGISGVGIDLAEQYLVYQQATGLNLLTVHPYTNFDSARSIQVDLALSAGYDLNMPIFFTEGAYALAFNSFSDWMRWCAASSLGWSLFQGMTPGVSGVTYRDQVGVWHSDMEVRIPTVHNYLTALAVSSGYDPEWIRTLRTKTDYGPLDANGNSTYWSPLKGSPKSPLSLYWLPSSSPYYSRYRIGGDEQELDENIPIGIINNWSASTMDLSAVRNLYLSEAGADIHLLEERRLQLGALNVMLDFVYYSASGWGVPTASVSSYFNQWNLTNSDISRIILSSTELTNRTYPGCLLTGDPLNFCDGSCFYGPNCAGGVFQNNGLDIIDHSAYTSFHKTLRNFVCELGEKVGIMSCIPIV